MISTYPSQMMAWHELLSEAEEKAKLQLEEDLKSYLIFVLMRLMKKPEMLFGAAALNYLESLVQFGESKRQSLRDVGDKCLLLSGFFPKQTIKRRVAADYFISLGSSAYRSLAEEFDARKGAKELSGLYTLISKKFALMTIVLMAAKIPDENTEIVSPLLAYELQKRTGSSFFLEELSKKSRHPIFLGMAGNTKH